MDKILTTQQAARLKKIKVAVAKVRADKQRRVRDRIEELTREKCDGMKNMQPELIKFELLPFNDGYGIVGYGAKCECGHYEKFISYWECEWTCEKCGKNFTFSEPE